MNSQAHATKTFDNAGLADRDELVALVYGELRRLAESYLRRERPDHTLQPTALVHEAYMRLVEQKSIEWQSREHLIGVAATMMRRVLINHAVRRKREKRGGGGLRLSLEAADRLLAGAEIGLKTLDEALENLALDYPRESRTVELRFFGGLSIAETARVLGVSDTTVERDWRFARAWLALELSSSK
jgi:RNA polymerase sigma factor (TIGR02999 family)